MTCGCDVQTCGAPPPRDAAGVVGLEELGGPGNADGADGRIVLKAFLFERKLLQLQQGNVVLVGAGVVTGGTKSF